MKNYYNIIFGLGLISAVLAGCYFNTNRYYYYGVNENEEVYDTNYWYAKDDPEIRIHYQFNFQAAFAAGVSF